MSLLASCGVYICTYGPREVTPALLGSTFAHCPKMSKIQALEVARPGPQDFQRWMHEIATAVSGQITMESSKQTVNTSRGRRPGESIRNTIRSILNKIHPATAIPNAGGNSVAGSGRHVQSEQRWLPPALPERRPWWRKGHLHAPMQPPIPHTSRAGTANGSHASLVTSRRPACCFGNWQLVLQGSLPPAIRISFLHPRRPVAVSGLKGNMDLFSILVVLALVAMVLGWKAGCQQRRPVKLLPRDGLKRSSS